MMSEKGHGRVLTDRAGGLCPEPAAQSQPEALIPRAGDWVVTCSRAYSCYMSHEVGVVYSVKPKTIWAKIGMGRRLNRFDRDNVIVAADEQDARRICALLDSAKAEANRRESEARSFYKQKLGKIYASAIEARRAETAQTGSVHESAVAKPDAQTQPGDSA